MTDRTIAAPIAPTASIGRTPVACPPLSPVDSGATAPTGPRGSSPGPGVGTVTETGAGDDGAAGSVEVRLEERRRGEVDLHEDVVVIGRDADRDGHER